MKTKYKDFINDSEILKLIESTKNPDKNQIKDILNKAKEKKGLNITEVALLSNINDKELLEELFETAKQIKLEIYGKRIVFFAPLYISNYCDNNCLYCAFRKSNKEVERKSLNDEELIKEVKALERQGHKRLIMVYGETAAIELPQYIAKTVDEVYKTKLYNDNNVEIGSIRRVNINAAPLDVDGYKLVKEAGIGTYQVFQETYHKETYKVVHPKGTSKSDYYWRLFSLHRAQEAGIDDVGIGALFGLYDWKFEILSLMYHAESLEKHFNVGPHTISFPRIEPAYNTPYTQNLKYNVSDADFKKIIAILRLAVPYTGLILTCRENPEMRNDAISLGVSQIDAGSIISLGGYSESEKIQKKEQFTLADGRSLDEVIKHLIKNDYIPSFCTGCYRLGRTGEHFMEMAKPGFIKKFCQPNAILTFLEYVEDFASEETKKQADILINNALKELPEDIKKSVIIKIKEIKSGKRDVFF